MARFRWSTALTLTLGLLAAARTTSTATVPQPKFFRWDPLVVRKTETKPVQFEFAVDGDPTRVVFELNANAATAGQPGVDYAMHDDGTAGDLVAGDGIYTISFPAQTLVSGLSADDVFRHFVGYVKLFPGRDASVERQYVRVGPDRRDSTRGRRAARR